MSRPTPNDRRDDVEVRGWIAEAGDVRVETRPEHVEQVRHLLLERVGASEGGGDSSRRGRDSPRDRAHPAPAARLVSSRRPCSGRFTWRPDRTTTGSRIAQTLHEQTWIHIVASGPDGLNEESWISPRFEILAKKHHRGDELGDAEFHDVEMGIKDEYIADQKTIYRDPVDDVRWKRLARKRRTREIEVFRQLLHFEEFKDSPFPDTEIIEQSHREVIERGKTWKVYSLTVRWTFGQKADLKMVIRVDPKTGLPQTWVIDVDGGKLRQTFDYPGNGPADILCLGVPATAKREDHLPEQSLDLVLSQVLNGIKVGRHAL